MLKIKDNVDLKELEKFGFEHIEMLIPRYIRGRVRIYYDIEQNIRTNIDQMNKARAKAKLPLMYDRAITVDVEIINRDKDNDVFDLIQARLVESVDI